MRATGTLSWGWIRVDGATLKGQRTAKVRGLRGLTVDIREVMSL